MRVLHVIPSVSLVHGGPSRAIDLMERALAASDVTMEVATTDDDGPGRRLLRSFGADHLRLESGAVSPVRRYFAKRTEFYKVSPGLAWWLARHAQEYDVIHIHALFSFSSIAAAWAAWCAGVPYIVRPLGSLRRYGVEKRRPWLKQLSLKLVEGPILRHASIVHFTSEVEREEAEALGIPLRANVIPLASVSVGVDDVTILSGRFPALCKRRYLLFLSRLDPVKNLEGLLGAMAILAQQFPEIMLVVAGGGDPDYVASLKKNAEQLGIASQVVWAGFVDGELKAGLLAGAQVFVLPSYSENFGIAAAEALQAGLPCVLGKGVAIAGDVENAGAGIAVGTKAVSIAEGISPYLSSQEFRNRASKAAAAYATAEFSLETMGARLRELYLSVCLEKKGQHFAQ